MRNRQFNKKILFILIFLLNIICFMPNICQAIDLNGLGDLDNYGKVNKNSPNFEGKVGLIIGVIQVVGSLGAVISLIVMGIRYMMGSIEEKVSYKKTLLPYFIGSILVFGISNLLQRVYKIAINSN